MGVRKLKGNISRFFKDISEKKTEAAVYQVANEGLAMSNTLTPVDTSNLINSQFSPIIESTATGKAATVGYNANYAFYVHERSGKLKGVPRANGNGYYWSPDAEPQFLKKGFDAIEGQIPNIIKAAHEIK